MGVSTTYEHRAFIAGKWVETSRRFPVLNPSTGETVTEVADCGPEEARWAAEAAVEAFGRWRAATAYERSAVLQRWRDLMLQHQEELARLMATEMGKPIRESRGEVRYAANFVEWFAEEAKRVYGETVPASFAHKRLLVQREPVGPALGITPWNFPAAMVTRKAAPALAAGCSFILKPAEQSPLTALYLARLLEEAGMPPGVFQVLPTLDPGPVADVLLEDRRIRKLTFTGSTAVGRMLAEKAARTLKRVSLELGGHAPVLVFEDADLELAAEETVKCKFRNAGQTCVCANRIYVQESIRDAFAEAFVERVRRLRVGSALDEQTDIGPLVDQQGFAKVSAHVRDAVEKGAQLVYGGPAPHGGTGGAGAGAGASSGAAPAEAGRATGRQGNGAPAAPGTGLFFLPTVLVGVTPEMRIAAEETFGPVAPLFTFKTEEEAIRLANDTPYGLAAYFFTRDVSRIFRVSEALEYGIVGVNDGIPSTPQAPFGGVKDSGLGREGGHEGIEEYLETKFISIGLKL